MKVDQDSPVSYAVFGAAVGISVARVAQLVELGRLRPGAPFREWVLDYTAQLRRAAAARGALCPHCGCPLRAGISKNANDNNSWSDADVD